MLSLAERVENLQMSWPEAVRWHMSRLFGSWDGTSFFRKSFTIFLQSSCLSNCTIPDMLRLYRLCCASISSLATACSCNSTLCFSSVVRCFSSMIAMVLLIANKSSFRSAFSAVRSACFLDRVETDVVRFATSALRRSKLMIDALVYGFELFRYLTFYTLNFSSNS